MTAPAKIFRESVSYPAAWAQVYDTFIRIVCTRFYSGRNDHSGIRQETPKTGEHSHSGNDSPALYHFLLRYTLAVLASVVDRSCLPDHRDLDLPRVFQCFLDFFDDILGKPGGPQIVDRVWLD